MYLSEPLWGREKPLCFPLILRLRPVLGAAGPLAWKQGLWNHRGVVRDDVREPDSWSALLAVLLLSLGLAWAPAGCIGVWPDARNDDASAGDDDDSTGGDDDSAGDDDTSVGDDDTSVGDDDTTVGDDDTSAGDDDTSAGDDDTSVGDDDTSVGDDDTSVGDDDTSVGDDDTSVGDDDTSVGDDDTSLGDDDTSLGDDDTSVVNTAPPSPGISITPAAFFEPGTQDLVCSIDTPSVDPDGDTVTYSTSWTVDEFPPGSPVAYTAATTTSVPGDTVPSGDTDPMDQWACAVVASDGTDTSTAATAERGIAVSDFSLVDQNDSSISSGMPVSPRDYLAKVSGWYFGHAT